MKQIYIDVPYAQKEDAKLLGARWDAVVRRWYITEQQDALLFQRWFSKQQEPTKPAEGRISLEDFLKQNYGTAIGLTYRSAKAFGIPYPPESGWAKKYAHRTAKIESVTVGKKEKKRREEKAAAPKAVVESCGCDALPWEDCEHTDYAANKAMLDMLDISLGK